MFKQWSMVLQNQLIMVKQWPTMLKQWSMVLKQWPIVLHNEQTVVNGAA